MIKVSNIEKLVSSDLIYQIFCTTNDEKSLLAINEGKLLVFEIQTKTIQALIPFPQEMIFQISTNICVSYDDRYCCVSTSAKKNGNTMNVLCRFNLVEKVFIDMIENYHLMPVDILLFIPQTYIVASLGKDQIIKFLDINQKQAKSHLTGFKNMAISIDFVQNNKYYVLVDNYTFIKIIQFESSRQMRKFRLKNRTFTKCKLIQEGTILLARTNRKQFIYSLHFGKVVRKNYNNQQQYCILLENRIINVENFFVQIYNINTGNLQHFEFTVSLNYSDVNYLRNSNSLLLGIPNSILYVPRLLSNEIDEKNIHK